MRYEAAMNLIDDSIMSLPAQDQAIRSDLAKALRQARGSQARAAAHRVGEQVRAQSGRHANWDCRGSDAASEGAINRAVAVLYGHAQEVEGAGLPWFDPRVGLSEEGHVVFEWWYDRNKLTLYVGDESIEYVSSWGPDLDDQMQAGVLSGNLLNLWTWLTLPPE